MNEIIIESLIDKANAGEKKIDDLEKRLQELQLTTSTFSDQSFSIIKLSAIVHELQTRMESLRFPEQRMNTLITLLKATTQAVSNPPKQVIVHKHQVPKIIWLTIGIFCIACLLCAGWLRSSDKANQYQTAHWHWRYLKLVTDTTTLKNMHQVETNYHKDKQQVEKWIISEELLIQQRQEISNKPVDTTSNLTKRKHRITKRRPAK